MSAPKIPNLLGLRGGPRSRGGPGRGRGDPGGRFVNSRQRTDLAIQATDTDAAVSRLSIVNLGYLEDPFATFFVNGPGTRRMPVINRGTYTRTSSLDILINAFLAPDSTGIKNKKQIISLGAGTDTRYFRLRAKKKHHDLIYHEFDFPDVSGLKMATVSKREELAKQDANESLFRSPPGASQPPMDQEPEWGFRTAEGETRYCFHPMDLRQLAYNGSRGLKSYHGVRDDLATLLISECCLCYLDVDIARDVIKFFMNDIPSLGIVLYEPIGVNDAFGQTMVTNLAARNITMPTVQEYKNLADQKRRMEELGFKSEKGEGGNEAVSVDAIWNNWIPATEKQRVDRLEGLDEVEEWQVIAQHYAVVWGWKGAGWEAWNGLRQSDR